MFGNKQNGAKHTPKMLSFLNIIIFLIIIIKIVWLLLISNVIFTEIFNLFTKSVDFQMIFLTKMPKQC